MPKPKLTAQYQDLDSIEARLASAAYHAAAVETTASRSPEPATTDEIITALKRGNSTRSRRLGSISEGSEWPTTPQYEYSSSAASSFFDYSPEPRPLRIRSRSNSETIGTWIESESRGHSRSESFSDARSDARRGLFEKPLPRTPHSPPLADLLQSRTYPPAGPDLYHNVYMRPAMSSRANTLDSLTSAASQQMYAAHDATNQMGDVNGSQGSIASSNENDEETRDVLTPRSRGPPSNPPSAQPQPQASSRAPPPAGSNTSTHLSGLMCNVHRTTGREPHPLVGATTTVLGDKLYVFGGRILSRTRPALTSDLYELDLIKRHWTKLETTGDVPPPRYFHSMCTLGDTKLVCYGGMSPAPLQGGQPSVAQISADAQPEVIVMSDIYIYDAPTRTWTFINTQETPQGRYAHCATILPSSATFSSVNAPSSALHHNPQGQEPNQGTIGVNIDGTGGAEMLVVGGQDSANHYIEQISVFNLRSLKWTMTQTLGKSCGAYRSVVAPVPNATAARIGKMNNPARPENPPESREAGASMLIYSNYNFLDVKLELQIRSPDGTLSEKPMMSTFSPPGLRFPNGGVIDTNFVVSGTYLTSSKQEYALWTLDLRSLTWSRIDAGGSVFSQGSWNRGVLWNRRNTFVILGNRKRSLVEDYNHRRINFSNVCMVELEAFGLYDNPRKAAPMSGYASASSPYGHPGLNKSGLAAGGRSLSRAAEELGQMALGMRELADMDIVCIGSERIPVNSRLVAQRWGPYFVQLLREGAATQDGADAATLRPERLMSSSQSRNSSITITPSIGANSTLSNSTTLNNFTDRLGGSVDAGSLHLPPDPTSLHPTSRPRTLYLPHTELTVQALLHFLYTSSLPPPQTALCTPQILCSLLQIARPYKIDGLLEAVVERLHSILDSRNAAAVFNASAMAAGGGRATSSDSPLMEAWRSPTGPGTFLDGSSIRSTSVATAPGMSQLRIDTKVSDLNSGANGDDDDENRSTTSSISDLSGSESVGTEGGKSDRQVWKGDLSAVIGLQKGGLRGLMEGRRLRERGQSVGLGIANGNNV